jgi:signal transduction histidine kinase
MRVPASVRSAWEQASSAAQRLGDLIGPGVVAAVVAAVVLLGALIGSLAREPWQVVSGVLLLLVLVAAVALVAARFLQPIRAMSRDVDRATTETLPAVSAALEAGAAADALPGVAPITAQGPGEVIALGAAVTSLSAAAVSLATQEHDRHRRTRDLTTHLARRNHGLVDRLVTQISELETAERSPSVLTQLSRLKHTATRTRRHAESMLVLAGALPDRTWPRPAGVTDVLRTALAGIEDHARVDTDDVEPVALRGSVVADLAHLVAELVENGAHFSPPGTRVRVTGAPVPGSRGYRIDVADHGVGMTVAQLDAGNVRIRGAVSGAEVTKLIGLDVVGCLAARHGITVTLAHGDGIVATVSVPERLLVPLSELPAPRRPVSALVAAAAFRPSSGEEKPPPLLAGDARVREPKPAAVAAPEFVRPGVPRRVRGAQLPDLGPDRKDGPHVAPDAGRVQGRLHSLQAGMSAARVNSIPPLPQQLPGPPSPDAERDGPPQATPAPAPDGDD